MFIIPVVVRAMKLEYLQDLCLVVRRELIPFHTTSRTGVSIVRNTYTLMLILLVNLVNVLYYIYKSISYIEIKQGQIGS